MCCGICLSDPHSCPRRTALFQMFLRGSYADRRWCLVLLVWNSPAESCTSHSWLSSLMYFLLQESLDFFVRVVGLSTSSCSDVHWSTTLLLARVLRPFWSSLEVNVLACQKLEKDRKSSKNRTEIDIMRKHTHTPWGENGRHNISWVLTETPPPLERKRASHIKSSSSWLHHPVERKKLFQPEAIFLSLLVGKWKRQVCGK